MPNMIYFDAKTMHKIKPFIGSSHRQKFLSGFCSQLNTKHFDEFSNFCKNFYQQNNLPTDTVYQQFISFTKRSQPNNRLLTYSRVLTKPLIDALNQKLTRLADMNTLLPMTDKLFDTQELDSLIETRFNEYLKHALDPSDSLPQELSGHNQKVLINKLKKLIELEKNIAFFKS